MYQFYNRKMPDPQLVEKASADVAKNVLAGFFSPVLPEFSGIAREFMGAFTHSIRESDPEIADVFDNMQMGGEDILEIFDDYLGGLQNVSTSTGELNEKLDTEVSTEIPETGVSGGESGTTGIVNGEGSGSEADNS